MNSPLSISASLLIHTLIGHLLDKEKHLSRRRFLSEALKMGVTAGIFVWASPFLVPYEIQAYTQTDGDIPNTLSINPYFKFSQTDLFDLEK